MAHHSSEHSLNPEILKKLAKQAQNQFLPNMQPGPAQEDLRERIGALGSYSEGQYGPHDEGDIRFMVGAQDGKVLVDFGTPVHSLGMTPDQAQAFAGSLLNWAREARRQNR